MFWTLWFVKQNTNVYIYVMFSRYYMVYKSITIKEEHEKWVRDNSINLSRYIQKKIDEEIRHDIITPS